MFLAGRPNGRRWNDCVRDTIVELQDHAGASGEVGTRTTAGAASGGRIYSTALAVLTLEVYYRYALERPDHRDYLTPARGGP